jgi:hypothetical protein
MNHGRWSTGELFSIHKARGENTYHWFSFLTRADSIRRWNRKDWSEECFVDVLGWLMSPCFPQLFQHYSRYHVSPFERLLFHPQYTVQNKYFRSSGVSQNIHKKVEYMPFAIYWFRPYFGRVQNGSSHMRVTRQKLSSHYDSYPHWSTAIRSKPNIFLHSSVYQKPFGQKWVCIDFLVFSLVFCALYHLNDDHKYY